MKNLLFICLLAVTFFSACKKNKQTSHETQWSSDKKDSVVYVNYRQQDGSFSNFYMNYMLYSMLFRQGGYGSVYNYYQQHPSEFSNQSRYSNYRSSSSFSSSNNHNSSSYKPSSNSYSSPSRSYSSPSRSYSSPSRSYSSPSRSYSSPSRSYSSPSRGR